MLSVAAGELEARRPRIWCSRMSELPIVHASGSPYQRGRIIGAALADGHQRSAEFTRRYCRRHGLSDRDLEPLLAPYLAAARRRAATRGPHRGRGRGGRAAVHSTSSRSTASRRSGPCSRAWFPARRCDRRRGARADCGGALHRFRDLSRRARPSLPTTSSGMPATTAVSRSSSSAPTPTPRSRPSHRPSVGTLPLVGMNARGGALGLMSLSGADEQIGVPRALLGRDGVEAVDRADAIRRAITPPPRRWVQLHVRIPRRRHLHARGDRDP